jgi:hypothetical protein
MAFLSKYDNNSLYNYAIIFSILIASSPAVDYWSNWYITLIPILIIVFGILQKRGFSKLIQPLVLGLLFSLFEYWIIHRQVDFVIQIRNNMMAFTPIVISVFLQNYASNKFLKNSLQLTAFFILITSLTTIIGLEIYPDASRLLASRGDLQMVEVYSKLNIGGFDFIYSLILFLPLSFWLIKNSKGIRKLLNIVTFIAILVCINSSSYATALLMSIVSISLILVNVKPQLKPFFIALGILIVLLAGTGLWSEIFLWMSRNAESAYVADRLLQISLIFGGSGISQITTDTSTERLELYQQSISSFTSSPIWGNNIISFNKEALSGHSVVLDTLAGSGLIGGIIVYLIFRALYKSLIVRTNEIASPFVQATWIMFVLVSIVNPSGFLLIYSMVFSFCILVQRLEHKKKYER